MRTVWRAYGARACFLFLSYPSPESYKSRVQFMVTNGITLAAEIDALAALNTSAPGRELLVGSWKLASIPRMSEHGSESALEVSRDLEK